MRTSTLAAVCLLVATTGCARQNLSPDHTTSTVPDRGEVTPRALEDRQEEVAERGAMVMPFDLERTTHVFRKLEKGGRQTVVSDDADPDQIRLIREHLTEEAEKFGRGDFHDPAMIHGADMAGLHKLMTGYRKILVEYREIENGAQILYTTDDPELVNAVHDWFDQQVSDHGRHAMDANH